MTTKHDSRKHAILLTMLRERREKSKLTQRQLAARLGKPQSWICRHERGELRLDFIELRSILQALDVSVVEFVKSFERRLAQVEEK